MYGNISQILLLYKTWGYYNKCDSTKSLGVCYWCVRIPQCGYMVHGLKLKAFYVQKHITVLAWCHNPALVCDNPLGAPAYVKLVYCNHSRVSFLPVWYWLCCGAFSWPQSHTPGLGSIQFQNWNCSLIPIPELELERELKLVELKMKLE